jgi:predicted PurR-regulated permease PerM
VEQRTEPVVLGGVEEDADLLGAERLNGLVGRPGRFGEGLLENYPTVQDWLDDAAQQGAIDPGALFDGVLSFGTGLVTDVANLFIIVMLTVLLLAVLAAVLDAVPLVGATIATVPVVVLALSVSVPTAAVVLALFVAYQQVENNLIASRAFRDTLRLTPLAVLVLPVAAAISAIARVRRGDDPDAPGSHAPWLAEAVPTREAAHRSTPPRRSPSSIVPSPCVFRIDAECRRQRDAP